MHRRHNEGGIEWNRENVSIVLLVLLLMGGVVYYSYADSKEGFEERMARYRAMSTEEMATFLAGLNAAPEFIDPITYHAGAEAKGTTMLLYRVLHDSMISDLIVNRSDLESEQAKMSAQLRREMCGLPTYDLFYEKGGMLRFVYHYDDGVTKHRMFEVNVDKKTCL